MVGRQIIRRQIKMMIITHRREGERGEGESAGRDRETKERERGGEIKHTYFCWVLSKERS